MDILIYAGSFLFEQHEIIEVLRARSREGVRCRFLIGEETSVKLASMRVVTAVDETALKSRLFDLLTDRTPT
ncbi:hypothetical protein [Pseudonocardia sp. NPDC046786]|uniref:hypothetical protein n=1 Tax=Pseudonocardia sp. NPDC046786 TaxID=3155471 RepID=UPI0033F3ED13